MKITKFLFNLLFISISLSFSQNQYALSQCVDNILINGSFHGNVGRTLFASGWNGKSSPDINDASGILFTSSPTYRWIGEILPSRDGGTWQNIIGPETISQTVELEMGKKYKMCIEYSAQGIIATPKLFYNEPVGVKIIINDVEMYRTAQDTTQYTWEYDCFMFIPIRTTNKIEFQATDYQYLGIDGACLTEAFIAEKFVHYFYPNPILSNYDIKLFTSYNIEFDIHIFNEIGILVYSDSNILANELEFKSSGIPPGVYFYTLKIDNDYFYQGKFILQ